MSLNTHDFYRVADPVSKEIQQALGATVGLPWLKFRMGQVKAQWTGLMGTPKAGNWYLSGATPEAYQAKADMAGSFPMARLVVKPA